ncbi:uncharacterized protein LOC118409185 [Branchiostoma floridae]|uniref:Uncharacterized protein LOC118409185 n=1 Tax=Branchiostoma floridae TaxID=7739 RepID=A0A9J7KM08_BRAFL|nr:uncharacterized protein LOC118409185 [Branchiostoma floridae]
MEIATSASTPARSTTENVVPDTTDDISDGQGGIQENDLDNEELSEDGFGGFGPPPSDESWESENPKQDSEVSSISDAETDDQHQPDADQTPPDEVADDTSQIFPPLMVEGLAIPAIDIVDVNNIAAADPVALVQALAGEMKSDLDDHSVIPESDDKALSDRVSI